MNYVNNCRVDFGAASSSDDEPDFFGIGPGQDSWRHGRKRSFTRPDEVGPTGRNSVSADEVRR